MKFITIKSFDNPVEANIVKAKLEDSGIPCFLKDENIVAINPLYANATGGIKLQINEKFRFLALEILGLTEQSYEQSLVCPACGSDRVHFVSSSKSLKNLFSFILSLATTTYPIFLKKVYKCDSCGKEFPIED